MHTNRKLPWILVLMLAVFGLCPSAFADTSPAKGGYTDTELALIRAAQIEAAHSRNTQNDDIVTRTTANAMVEKTLAHLNGKLAVPLTEATLMAVDANKATPRLSANEKRESFMSGMDYLKFASLICIGILFLIVIGYYFGRSILKALAKIPGEAWEVTAALIGIGLFTLQGMHVINPSMFWSVVASIFIAASLLIATLVHKEWLETEMPREKTEEDFYSRRKNQPRLRIYLQCFVPIVMMISFAIGALLTASPWLGAAAVLALFALLGFVGEVLPFGYAVGFRSKNALARGTVVGILIVAILTGLRLFDVAPSYLGIFETGGLVIGSLISYLGLLIVTNSWYDTKDRPSWLLTNLLALAYCLAGVFVGSLLGLKSVQIIAGVFLALGIIEKMLEIPGKSVGAWAFKGMLGFGLVYAIVHYGAPFYAARFIH